MHAIYDLIILLLGIYTDGAFVLLAQKYILRDITAVLFTGANPWKQLKCPSAHTAPHKAPLESPRESWSMVGAGGGTRVKNGVVS